MKKAALDSATATIKRRASRIASALVAMCTKCSANVGASCVSIEERGRGKALKRCHTERYVAARDLGPTKVSRKANKSISAPHKQANLNTNNEVTNNLSEVLTLGGLSGGFSPVPLIFLGRVVDLDVTEVFGRAKVIAATIVSPPRSHRSIKAIHEESYLVRHQLGDKSARAKYLQLMRKHVAELAKRAADGLQTNELVAEDLVGEARMLALSEFGRWIPKKHGAFVDFLLPKLVARLKERANERLFERVKRGTETNIDDFAMFGSGTGMPLLFNGRVIEDDPMQACVMAKQLASTMGKNAPASHKKIGLEQELSYVARFRLGDVNSAWEFIHVNQALVNALVKKAKRMLPGNDLSEEDLCAEGRVGAFEAFKRWDPAEGKFSTYAFSWILAHLQGKAARGGSTISVRQELHLSLSRAKSEGRALSETEAALDRVRIVASIDDTTTDHEGKTRAKRAAAIASDQDVERDVADADARSRIKSSVQDALTCLSEREREIIVARMFGSEDAPITLEELGQRYRVSRERVRQIEANARRKMRVEIAARFGGETNVLAAMGA
jgi:RNA polymerase sigma-32 factor